MIHDDFYPSKKKKKKNNSNGENEVKYRDTTKMGAIF